MCQNGYYQKKKKKGIKSVSRNVGKKEIPVMIGGNINEYSTVENNIKVPPILKNRTAI